MTRMIDHGTIGGSLSIAGGFFAHNLYLAIPLVVLGLLIIARPSLMKMKKIKQKE
jgi:hypothetical protein